MGQKKVVLLNRNGDVVSETNIDALSFSPQDYDAGLYPVVVNAPLSSTIYVSVAGACGDLSPKKISPLAEQVLIGNVYGDFVLNEPIVQSNITPKVVNYFSDSTYIPTIGSIGATTAVPWGEKAGQFKGTFNDDPNYPAAGISLPPFSSAGTTGNCFLISGFMYLESDPSTSYDPVLICRGVCGSAGVGLGRTGDSFSLEYDSDVGQKRLKFYFSHSSHTNAGYSYTVNVSPAGGVTLNQWHHFAVSWINAGSSAAISGYWNGALEQKISTIAGNIRNTEGNVFVGCAVRGNRPYKGWLDDIIVSAGNTTGGSFEPLRGFRGGSTGPVPTVHQDASFYTVYYLSMDGPQNTSFFPCDTTNRLVSNVAYQDGSALYIYGTVGTTASLRWTDTVVGVCGGHAVSGATAGYLFGYESGSCMIINSVTDLTSGLTGAKEIKKNLMDYTFRYLLGFQGITGASGASGDLPNLYSGSTFPTDFSYIPSEANLNYLTNVYNSIVVNGSTSSVAIEDANGIYYSFATGPAVNLYKDVLRYFNIANTDRSTQNLAIDSKANLTDLKRLSGFSEPRIVSKLAHSGNKGAFIPPNAVISGNQRSPDNWWLESVEQQYYPVLD